MLYAWTEVSHQIFAGREMQICEIYIRKHSVYVEKNFLIKKYFYKWAKHRFATMSLSQNDSPWIGNMLTLQ